MTEEFNLAARGLSFFVDQLELFGSPPARLKVWATLHFLPLGSPFCCVEPLCHMPLYGEHLERVNDAVRRGMGIRQAVSVTFSVNSGTVLSGVEFDDVFSGRGPDLDPSKIDQRDALGRTALMRAAVRGHIHLVEALLARGANPVVMDHRGRGIMEQMPRGETWIIAMIEEAIGKVTTRMGGSEGTK
ncbi:MAG: ankyrin repeat domain-containing protein [Planctomycetota bacterium]|nr:ankyrin repeat domain-containing protein [Planctomycetota bacterium]